MFNSQVCRATKQLLVIIERRPIFNILKLNPGLVNYVDQLAKINKLRRNILLMKCYFMCCKVRFNICQKFAEMNFIAMEFIN